MTSARRLLAAAGAIVASTTILVGPAAAADRGLIVELDGPPATLTSASAPVTGRVRAGQAMLNLTAPQVDTITLRIVPVAGGAPVASVTQSPDRAAPVSFSWNPSIPRNGNYRVEASASGSGTLGLASASGDTSRTFAVAALPRAPQNVTAVVKPDGGVTVSWARNTEADILGYRVFRSDPGSSTFFQIGPRDGLAHTACPARCELTDSGPAAIGGEYGYQVLAFRAGPAEPLASPASRTATASVPLPTTTTGPPEVGGPVPAPGAAAGSKPAVGSARGPAISNFLGSQPPPKPPPPPLVLEPPDTGFNRDLPFGALPEDLEEPGAEEAVPPDDILALGSDADEVSQGRPLVPVAAGLLLLVVAAHLRRFVSHTRPAASAPAGELPATAAGAAAWSGPMGAPEPLRPRPRSTVTVLGASHPHASDTPTSASTANGQDPDPDPALDRGRAPLFADDFATSRGGRNGAGGYSSGHSMWDDGELDAEASAVDAAARGESLAPRRAFVPVEEIEEPLFAPGSPSREPVRVGGGSTDVWDESDVWEVVSPDR